MVVTPERVLRSAAPRRFGAHRRCGISGIKEVCGLPLDCSPDA